MGKKNFRGRARERLCYSFYINAASGLKEEFKDRLYKWEQIDNLCSVQDLSLPFAKTSFKVGLWSLTQGLRPQERALRWSSDLESEGRARECQREQSRKWYLKIKRYFLNDSRWLSSGPHTFAQPWKQSRSTLHAVRFVQLGPALGQKDPQSCSSLYICDTQRAEQSDGSWLLHFCEVNLETSQRQMLKNEKRQIEGRVYADTREAREDFFCISLYILYSGKSCVVYL